MFILPFRAPKLLSEDGSSTPTERVRLGRSNVRKPAAFGTLNRASRLLLSRRPACSRWRRPKHSPVNTPKLRFQTTGRVG
jgi:hypothetical protein